MPRAASASLAQLLTAQPALADAGKISAVDKILTAVGTLPSRCHHVQVCSCFCVLRELLYPPGLGATEVDTGLSVEQLLQGRF